jgi:alanine racemase
MVRLPHAVPVGSQVVVIGKQGDEEITTDELIDRWHTSQADIVSGINLRVPRVYIPVGNGLARSENIELT